MTSQSVEDFFAGYVAAFSHGEGGSDHAACRFKTINCGPFEDLAKHGFRSSMTSTIHRLRLTCPQLRRKRPKRPSPYPEYHGSIRTGTIVPGTIVPVQAPISPWISRRSWR
jgi:hypothetical protein